MSVGSSFSALFLPSNDKGIPDPLMATIDRDYSRLSERRAYGTMIRFASFLAEDSRAPLVLHRYMRRSRRVESIVRSHYVRMLQMGIAIREKGVEKER